MATTRIHSALRGFSLMLRALRDSDRDNDFILMSGNGVPSGGTLPNGQVLDAGQCAVYFRADASAITGQFYATVNGGTSWTAFTGLTTVYGDTQALNLGDANDIAIAWDGTRLNVTQALVNSEIRWGVSGAGIDQKFYGDTVGSDMTWDQSADSLIFGDNAKVVFGTGSDISVYWDATDLIIAQAAANSAIKAGVSGAGIDLVLFGDTATRDLTWDQSADTLRAADNTKIGFGSGAGTTPDIHFSWDATKLVVGQLTANSAIEMGVDGAGIDLVLYGDTASAAATWDQSADSLILSGVAKIKLQTIAAATTTAIPVTHSGSFPITTAAAETNTLADPSYLGQTMSLFVDTFAVGSRVVTAASRINQAANTIMTFGAVGDFIKLEAITIAGALKWQVVANDGVALS